MPETPVERASTRLRHAQKIPRFNHMPADPVESSKIDFRACSRLVSKI